MKKSQLNGPKTTTFAADIDLYASAHNYASELNVSNRQLSFFFQCNISKQLFNFMFDYSIVSEIAKTSQHLLRILRQQFGWSCFCFDNASFL